MADGAGGCGCDGRTLLYSMPPGVDSAGTVSNDGRAAVRCELQDRACWVGWLAGVIDACGSVDVALDSVQREQLLL